jgi:hypothetical protein
MARATCDYETRSTLLIRRNDERHSGRAEVGVRSAEVDPLEGGKMAVDPGAELGFEAMASGRHSNAA